MGALDVVELVSVLLPSELRRFIVGRSGSSAAGVFPPGVVEVDVVVESVLEAELSVLRRFMVGRSGSSAGAVVLLAVDPEFVAVVDAVDVPEASRRFIVGRSGSSLVDVLELFVESVLLSVGVAAGLLWSVPAEDAVSPGFEPKWGPFDEVTRTGSVFDGLSAVVVLFGAARGLTSP